MTYDGIDMVIPIFDHSYSFRLVRTRANMHLIELPPEVLLGYSLNMMSCKQF
jgi:hypothetical protein